MGFGDVRQDSPRGNNVNTHRKRGRPVGSSAQVLRGKDLSLPHFAAAKAYLYGMGPLAAVKRYLSLDDAGSNHEVALRQIGAILEVIAERGGSRGFKPTEAAQEAANRTATDLLRRTAQACADAVRDKRRLRREAAERQKKAATERAERMGLKYVPAQKMPALPPHLQKLRAFQDWYDRKYNPSADPDDWEYEGWLEDHRADWYREQGILYEIDYTKAHRDNTEPPEGTNAGQGDFEPSIDPDLRAKAGRHIDLLQSVVANRPRAQDKVEAWFEKSMVELLKAADIFTMYSLGELIKERGANWWREIPGLGPTRAQRIQDWLLGVKVEGVGLMDAHFESIQFKRMVEVKRFLESSTAPPLLQEVQLEPLATYLEDTSLNGAAGRFRRAEPNTLGANNDIEAVAVALLKYKERCETLAVYAREICRFCLWAYQVERTPLSSMDVQQARRYREFIQDIPAHWISQVKDAPPRGSSDWRPFRGQLDKASQRKALTSINVIFGALHEGGYLTGNTFGGVLKQAKLGKPTVNVNRSLAPAQWDVIRQVLDKQPPSPSARRDRALMHLLYATGLRRDELFHARMGAIERRVVDGERAHLLTVVGKGDKERTIPVPNDVMDMVLLHLADRAPSFNDDFQSKEGRSRIPFISVLGKTVKAFQIAGDGSQGQERDIVFEERQHASVDGALSAAGMSACMHRILRACRQPAIDAGLDMDAFEQASLHWMRHSFGRTMADANIDLRILQQALGHASINTTAHYTKADIDNMVRTLRQGRAVPQDVIAAGATETKTLDR